MVVCYIGLGSNLGHRRKNIESAIVRINQIKNTRVIKRSSIIETLPVGGPKQGKFLNAAVKINTSLPPRELLTNLKDIELELGRVPTVRNGPRSIDLDILIYGNRKINTRVLTVPHPRMRGREFVLLPLEEIAPNLVKRIRNEDNKDGK